MGYACPVCSTPQADQRHLADHLAVTAMVHGDDHEEWLDEHVPDWSSMGPADLGPLVAEHAIEPEYDAVFEDTTDGHDGGPDPHDHRGVSGDRLEDHLAREGHRGPGGRGDLTDEQRAILEAAREMTREMRGEDRTNDGDDDGEDGSSAADAGQ